MAEKTAKDDPGRCRCDDQDQNKEEDTKNPTKAPPHRDLSIDSYSAPKKRGKLPEVWKGRR